MNTPASSPISEPSSDRLAMLRVIEAAIANSDPLTWQRESSSTQFFAGFSADNGLRISTPQGELRLSGHLETYTEPSSVRYGTPLSQTSLVYQAHFLGQRTALTAEVFERAMGRFESALAPLCAQVQQVMAGIVLNPALVKWQRSGPKSWEASHEGVALSLEHTTKRWLFFTTNHYTLTGASLVNGAAFESQTGERVADLYARAAGTGH